MLIIRKAFRFILFAWGAIFLSGIAFTAAAQTAWQESDPCETGLSSFAQLLEAGTATHGLTPMDYRMIVYDSNQSVCWLADANLASDPGIRAMLGVAGINLDGTMDYPTAVKWVKALNTYNHGQGYMGHNKWQLPETPLVDSTCSGNNNGGFGASCSGSALGNLYYVGLARPFPDSVDPHFTKTIWPLRNLQPSLYWTSDPGANSGQETFSFNTDLNGSNTSKYNYLHVLPMVAGAIGAPPSCPSGFSGVLPYTSGPAADKAVYDCNTESTWTLDANLAASNNFGVTGSTTIIPDANTSPELTVPLIDADGTMLLATATADGPDGWLWAMNNESYYAGTNNWTLPDLNDLVTLFQDLNLQPGDVRLEAQGPIGPFWNIQPFFYWACELDPTVPNANSQSPCDYRASPSNNSDGTPLEYSFDLDNGFEGTDLAGQAGKADVPGAVNDKENKQFYVMVYYPVPHPSH